MSETLFDLEPADTREGDPTVTHVLMPNMAYWCGGSILTKSYADLCREAAADLPLLVAQARAKLAAPGRFSVAPSDRVPGSGRVAESVLVFEAPATRDNRARPWLARSA